MSMNLLMMKLIPPERAISPERPKSPKVDHIEWNQGFAVDKFEKTEPFVKPKHKKEDLPRKDKIDKEKRENRSHSKNGAADKG